MAKAKKTAALTVEERLEKALVPEVEQPYQVPENWVWANLPFVCRYIRAGGDKPACFSEEKTDLITIPVVANGISNEGIVGYTDIANEKENTITISGRGTIGFSVLRKYPYYPIIRLIVICPKERINSLYIKYIFDHFLESGTGSSIPQLTVPMLKNKGIPIPPFAEQQRIVDRIESLFAKLDEAKEKAQAALDSFETRRAAILHKAFTGELTAKWREKNGVEMDSWKERRINEISKPKAGYAFDSKLFSTHGFQIVRMGNLFGGELDLSRTPVFINESNVDPSIIDKFLICKGDILLTLTGTKYKRDYGYAVKIEDNSHCLLNQRILSLTPNNGVVPNFILYYLRSDIFRDIFFSNETGGVNQGNVSSKFVESIEIMLPQSLEQSEIVRLLDEFFAKEQKAKDLCSVIDNIDLIKKSILARAFRGELGTNDPTEESAVELLKTIC